VAWQGWRDGRAAICVAEQRGDQFSAASKIFQTAMQTIAADRKPKAIQSIPIHR
jgi:hypothetical protein